jgi:hypothetical protein
MSQITANIACKLGLRTLTYMWLEVSMPDTTFHGQQGHQNVKVLGQEDINVGWCHSKLNNCQKIAHGFSIA